MPAMRVFVVSLERSADRRAEVRAALDRAGIGFEFFDAIDGSESGFLHSDRADPRVTKARKGWTLTNGQLACFASHLCLWHKCIDLGEPVVVLEDDVEPDEGAKHAMALAFEHADRYGFIKLASLRDVRFRPSVKLDDGHWIGRYRRNTCGTQAYIVAPDAAGAFARHADRFLEPVDDYMEKPWLHGVKTYSVRPSLFSHLPVETVMAETRRIKHARSSVARLRATFFRGRETLLRLISG
jgi:glycosyl transferase, family 25